MAYEQLSQQIAETFILSNGAIHSQRALVLGAQTLHYAELGYGTLTESEREAWLGRCWSKSVLAQDIYSKRHQPLDPTLENYRTMASVLAGSLLALDRLQEVGVTVVELQTPKIFQRQFSRPFNAETYNPLALINARFVPPHEDAA